MIFFLSTGTSALIIYISNIQRTPKYIAVMYYAQGHFFCWECLGEAHAPATCSRYQVTSIITSIITIIITCSRYIMICCHSRSLKKNKNEQNKYITSSQEWLIKCASIDPEELHSTCQKVHAASKFSICYDPRITDLLIYLSEGLCRLKGL